jgi:hypothetical protein
MPKTQKRRRAPAKASTAQSRAVSATQSAASTASINRRFLSPSVSGPQNLIFPALVGLGSWGMAFTLIFLTTDPNRYLIGGMAILIALLWSFSFSVRLRKLLLLRQRSRS